MSKRREWFTQVNKRGELTGKNESPRMDYESVHVREVLPEDELPEAAFKRIVRAVISEFWDQPIADRVNEIQSSWDEAEASDDDS